GRGGQRGMSRRICTAVCIAMVLSVLSGPSAWAFSPRPGPTFNNPYGTIDQKYVIQRRVNQAIDSTPRGGAIRIAVWAISLSSSANKLVRAHRRGVDVRVIVQRDRSKTPQFRQLQRVLGTNARNRSFAITCGGGCRVARGGSMHAKFFLFSRVGRSQRVVMVSSANLTHGGARRGWNDAFTAAGNYRLYGAHRIVFEEMAKNRGVAKPYRVTTSHRYRAFFFPRPGDGTRETDTVYEALRRVRCWGVRGGAGYAGRTVIRVSMFHWAGQRGMYLARRLRALDAAGCIVQVIYGAPSHAVARELRKPGRYGGVAVWDSRYDLTGDGKPDKYVHHKYMLVSGSFAGDRSAWHVWTGSHNWTPSALRRNDETILKVSGQRPHDHYRANFNHIRRNKTRLAHRGGFTATSIPTFSTVLPERG
ncbi:MAG: phospholipase D-like domain-containing protein, partial [Thermocrispum sp.]